MPRPLSQSDSADASFEQRLASAFRQRGWKIQGKRSAEQEADLLVAKGKFKYAVALKQASEGRKDRLIPLLAQAILEAEAAVRAESRKSLAPLAAVGAPRIVESLLPEIREFAERYAPGVAIGLVDQEGFRAFIGPGLDFLNARRPKPRLVMPPPGPATNLFSDLNQWMLKVLFAPRLREGLVSAPRAEAKNASHLAQVAGVSVMSAFRFLRQVANEGFLDDAEGVLKLVRVSELMRRWQAASLRPAHEIGMKFVTRGSEKQFRASLRSYSLELKRSSRHRGDPGARGLPRLCFGLFAAADAFRVRFVHGVPPHLYLERFDNEVLVRLRLQPAEGGKVPDAYVRIPWAPESIFRAAVDRDGVPVCDILQVWLDVSSHPARGAAQADRVRSRLLAPLFEGSR